MVEDELFPLISGGPAFTNFSRTADSICTFSRTYFEGAISFPLKTPHFLKVKTMVDGEDCDFQLALTTNASDLPPRISQTCQRKSKSLTSENDAGVFVRGVSISFGGGLLTA